MIKHSDKETLELISAYIADQPETKRNDVQELHALIIKILPQGRLWFDDGRNDDGKIVTNPSIGYGLHTLKYANGKIKEFFQIGVSANKSGISVYILGIPDKTYLTKTYSEAIGKATVTGYCIKFNKLKDVNINVLEEAIRYGINVTG